jgi:hypothetical protein
MVALVPNHHDSNENILPITKRHVFCSPSALKVLMRAGIGRREHSKHFTADTMDRDGIFG